MTSATYTLPITGMTCASCAGRVERALLNCMDALKSMNDRSNELDHEKVIACTTRPDQNRGLLEALLIRARSPRGTKLSPMPRIK